jgi:hypothetical protein
MLAARASSGSLASTPTSPLPGPLADAQAQQPGKPTGGGAGGAGSSGVVLSAVPRLLSRALFSAPGSNTIPPGLLGSGDNLSPGMSSNMTRHFADLPPPPPLPPTVCRRASWDDQLAPGRSGGSSSLSAGASHGFSFLSAGGPAGLSVATAALSPQRSPRDPMGLLPEPRTASCGALAAAVSSAFAGIASEARHDGALAERVAGWKEKLRERGESSV